MEHACHRCGATIEEGVAFCPHCNAPQIRVAIPEPPPALIPGEVPAQPGYPSYTQVGKIQWAKALPVTIQAGLVAAVLLMFPLGIFGLLLSGGLAVALYRRRTSGFPVTAGMGGRLGAATGAATFAIFTILGAVQVAFFHTGGQLRELMLDAVRQAAERNSDPQAQQVVEYLKTPAGMAVSMVFGLAAMLCFCLILSALGGAVGAVWFGRKRTS